MIHESENEHGALAQRLVNYDDLQHLIAELEGDLKDMRRHGNIRPHERRTKFAEPEATSKNRNDSLINELGNRKNHLSSTYKSACPTQKGIDYMDYTTETTKKVP